MTYFNLNSPSLVTLFKKVRPDPLQKKVPKLVTGLQKSRHTFKSSRDLYQSIFENLKDIHQGPSKSRKYIH
jgi:hypothetical protein